MQSLLPGLTFAVESALELLNTTRAVLGLEPVLIRNGDIRESRPRRGRPRRAADEPEVQEESETAETLAVVAAPRKARAKRKQWTAKQRRDIGERTRQRWAAMREAGITPRNNSPSTAEVERALKIIERRNRKSTAKAA
ncbi:MAG TPA: hypothetical protein VK789_09410 [Bryobacteraceae bacterium]|nr:hypothetical protein [Bryobacteraceae bacterium]